jgi:signal peptidase II
LIAGVVVAVVAVDQVTKSVIVSVLRSGPVHVVGPVSLVLAYNSGAAFSIGVGLTLPIVIVGVVIVGVLASYARRVPSTLGAVAIGLLLGGAVGNLADRLFRGHQGAVIDFVHVGFWPTFNVADSCIVCGSIILAAVYLRSRPTEKLERTERLERLDSLGGNELLAGAGWQEGGVGRAGPGHLVRHDGEEGFEVRDPHPGAQAEPHHSHRGR